MERLPKELLFLILKNLSIGDSVSLFGTCRGFMKLGSSFLETYLRKTEEARLVADGKLTVVGAIIRKLSLDQSIQSGRPYSIQLISSETDGQFMCYNNLICFLRPGYICIYNNCGACEYTISIREIEITADPTDQTDENEEGITVMLCDFNYYKLTVAFVDRFVCIELMGKGSWQIIYDHQMSIPFFFALSTISSGSIVRHAMMHTLLYFEWFDFEKREIFVATLDRLRGPSSVVQIVSSGHNVYILLSNDKFFEIWTMSLEKYRSCPFIYPCGKDGLTVLAPTYVGNPIIFQPYGDKPGFPWLSRAYFEIADNDTPQLPVYKDSTGTREIERARVSNQAGIVPAAANFGDGY
ncbi:hypothetical protein BJX96DRAFT_183664 [Aspergillus floccosus]